MKNILIYLENLTKKKKENKVQQKIVITKTKSLSFSI